MQAPPVVQAGGPRRGFRFDQAEHESRIPHGFARAATMQEPSAIGSVGAARYAGSGRGFLIGEARIGESHLVGETIAETGRHGTRGLCGGPSRGAQALAHPELRSLEDRAIAE